MDQRAKHEDYEDKRAGSNQITDNEAVDGACCLITNRSTNERRTYKLIVIGDPGVGKTSLIRAQAGMFFRPEYIATIGADVITRMYEFKKQTIFVLLFDIAGQSLYDSINDYFFTGASGALLVFDLTRKETLEDVQAWSSEVRKIIPYPIPITLIGNKADLEQSRKVRFEEGKQVAVAAGIHTYVEASARTTENVDKAFLELLARCLVEAPKESRLASSVEEAISGMRASDAELVAEIKKLDDIGRRNTRDNKRM